VDIHNARTWRFNLMSNDITKIADILDSADESVLKELVGELQKRLSPIALEELQERKTVEAMAKTTRHLTAVRK